MNSYWPGQSVRLTAAFTNSAGAAADPTAVTCKVKTTRNGPTTTHTYGSGSIVKDSTGNYHLDITLTVEGDGYLFYRWEGTGTLVAAEDNVLGVKNSVFV